MTTNVLRWQRMEEIRAAHDLQSCRADRCAPCAEYYALLKELYEGMAKLVAGEAPEQTIVEKP